MSYIIYVLYIYIKYCLYLYIHLCLLYVILGKYKIIYNLLHIFQTFLMLFTAIKLFFIYSMFYTHF